MADIIKLRDWHNREADDAKTVVNRYPEGHAAEAFAKVESAHRETARILDLLARVRAEHVHRISQKLSWDGEQCAMTIYGPTELMRELAEALGEKP